MKLFDLPSLGVCHWQWHELGQAAAEFQVEHSISARLAIGITCDAGSVGGVLKVSPRTNEKFRAF